ncbi:MAG: efflux RND transporter permease subunit [Pseudomonadales bacterium]
MPRFFIDRPVFAWVIAIFITLGGVLSIFQLPVEQYPGIAPPSVTVQANYPGASAETAQNSVTQVIEQQLTGIDNLLYFSASSSSSGQVQITATFAPGTDPDIAQVQVQNKVQQATPRLPLEVQQQGISVQKSQPSFQLIVALSDTTGRYDAVDIADYVVSNLQDPISRVPGVGEARVFGSSYAMRIWLDPYKLVSYNLTPADVRDAVRAQNTQVSAGALGAQPATPEQQFNATVTAQSRFSTPEEFENIILKSSPEGGIVRLADVARVEIGADNYGATNRLNRRPSAGMPVSLAPGANTLTTIDAVKARAIELAQSLPEGMELSFPVDNTRFIRLSIEEVILTLLEAIGLVILVMFLFLQNWRATLIPGIAVPVVLFGTFGALIAFGFTINTLTLFALVLSIGLLVDDAIVVIENVERVMREEGLSPREATRKSMGQITGALIAIALVLSAVFVPMAFFGGSTGVIYRQFSVTIVSAMALSLFVAMTLTPALCATLLKPLPPDRIERHGWFFTQFNHLFESSRGRYLTALRGILKHRGAAMAVYAVIVAVMAVLFVRMPTGFLPEEDQGGLFTPINLPVGAMQSRTLEVASAVEKFYLDDEKDNIHSVFVVAGFSFAGQGQNAGQAFVNLKDWDERPGEENSAQAIVRRAFQAFSQVRDARIFALLPSPIRELGNATGFEMQLQDRRGLGHDALMAARDQLLTDARSSPVLAQVRHNGLDDTPQLRLNVDQAKANTLGVKLADINYTLSAAWGGAYLNDFIDRGRVKRVYMQGDAPFRMTPDDLNRWYVRTESGSMAPFSSFVSWTWELGPSKLERYNGIPSLNIQGQPAPGYSTGAAMAEMERLVAALPAGFGLEWTGASFQERLSGAQAPLLYGISLLVVFLCLAALYESWTVPVAVLLVVPLGIIGAVLAAMSRGLYNDIYFQVGLLATMGLAAKNAILIIEFAEAALRKGVDATAAALDAARLRLRPIIMTSFAFIAGVFPLVIATGAGAASQNDIGTGVVGGMFSGVMLAIFLVPVFFVIVRGRYQRRTRTAQAGETVPGG